MAIAGTVVLTVGKNLPLSNGKTLVLKEVGSYMDEDKGRMRLGVVFTADDEDYLLFWGNILEVGKPVVHIFICGVDQEGGKAILGTKGEM
jgi:hypothetical protein